MRAEATMALGLAAKVAFLSEARGYPDNPRHVEAVETHMSWVFLTDDFAYKLKKAERFDGHDLGTVEARRAHCAREITLNRRLTDGVYIDSLALVLGPNGFRIGGEGPVVDWLIRMRRLPARLALDALIRAGRVPADRLREAIGILSRHYRMVRPEPLSAAQWRARLSHLIDANRAELCKYRGAVATEVLERVSDLQQAFLRHESRLFEARVAAGRIVEAHGDLRPEHIFLEPRPQIIDCLEFSRPLRVLDVAEELGFLALECERLGAPGLGAEIFATHAAVSGDRPPQRLVDFYQAVQACNRAKLALWHLRDAVHDFERWPARAREYVALAARHMDSAGIPVAEAALQA